MNVFSPTEIIENYSNVGEKKANLSVGKMIVSAIIAGMIIALGGASTNTAAFTFETVSAVRLICGLLFPFGLGMVVLTGTELFTGNCLVAISVLDKKVKITKMLRNWLWVYFGNFIGSIFIAVSCSLFGQFNYGSGMLGVFTIKLALAKCQLPFMNALISGVICNFLVSLGVLLSMSAKDTIGKIGGAFLPVAYFVFCGFEHSVANMYYVPAGILALKVENYSSIINAMGIDVSNLNWGSFIVNNLIPVTIGNILGGMAVGAMLWYVHKKKD